MERIDYETTDLQLYRRASTLRQLAHPFADPGFQSRHDFFEVKVEREDISGLAVGMIQEIGADASPELIAQARELVEFADEHLNTEALTQEQQDFIKGCEDNAGETIRPHENARRYYKRLMSDYG